MFTDIPNIIREVFDKVEITSNDNIESIIENDKEGELYLKI